MCFFLIIVFWEAKALYSLISLNAFSVLSWKVFPSILNVWDYRLKCYSEIGYWLIKIWQTGAHPLFSPLQNLLLPGPIGQWCLHTCLFTKHALQYVVCSWTSCLSSLLGALLGFVFHKVNGQEWVVFEKEHHSDSCHPGYDFSSVNWSISLSLNNCMDTLCSK